MTQTAAVESAVEGFAALRERSQAVYDAWLRPERPRIDVAIDTSSIAHGAGALREALEAEATARGAVVEFGTVTGFGLQWLHPTVTISWPDGTRALYGPATTDDVTALIDEATGRLGAAAALAAGTVAGSRPGLPAVWDHPFLALETERRLLARLGQIDPGSIEHYIATGGYAALSRMLTRHQQPEQVRQLMMDGGLTGRGGAYFPAGLKWNFLAGAAAPKTLICNADEGDPGAWVNRVLLEGDPHLLIEGMLIAAFATGAEHGFIYLRSEYPLAVERTAAAIAQAEAAGLLGERVLDSDFGCTLELVVGAGAYVCGEETGLINSLHDERGMPRVKPPFPANPGGGVFGRPSNVNNVETYCSAPLILRYGAAWYREQGTDQNAGTKLFSFSGAIDRTGFMELPWGVPLRAVLEACGGISGGRALKAVQAGGPLAGYLPARIVDVLTLERESFQPHDALAGSGGVVFIADDNCSIEINAMFADFLEDESCGRCTTCHGGNQRMTEIFRRIADGGGRQEDAHSLELVGDALQYSNCVHGSASPTVMRNTLRLFPEEYAAHVEHGQCEALRCAGLVRFRVADQADARLAAAAAICPVGAIERSAPEGAAEGETGASYAVVQERCIRCGACTDVAPRGMRREAAPRGGARPSLPVYGAPASLQR